MHVFRFTGALALSFAFIPGAGAQGLVVPATEKKIDALLAQMTLEEKAGQLNQYSSAFDVTGPAPSAGAQKVMYDQVRQGLVGSVLNVTGAEATRKMQQLAVENSRLKIPMIFGLDVIHGYRTMFPVPLGEAASWDVAAIEQSARVGAAAADHIRNFDGFRSRRASALSRSYLGRLRNACLCTALDRCGTRLLRRRHRSFRYHPRLRRRFQWPFYAVNLRFADQRTLPQ